MIVAPNLFHFEYKFVFKAGLYFPVKSPWFVPL